MRIFYDNKVDFVDTVITAATENTLLPVENVQHPWRTKPYRTGVSQASEWVKFDLGSAKAIRALILLDHTLQSGDTGLKLQGNSSDSWTSPPVDETLTFRAGLLYHLLDTDETYQWWRITFTKDSASEYRDFGRIFLGPMLELNDYADVAEMDVEPEDLSTTDRALGGATLSDIYPIYETYKIPFRAMHGGDHANSLGLIRTVGTHTPWFVQIDELRTEYEWFRYVKFKTLPKTRPIAWDPAVAAYLYKTTWELNEEL